MGLTGLKKSIAEERFGCAQGGLSAFTFPLVKGGKKRAHSRTLLAFVGWAPPTVTGRREACRSRHPHPRRSAAPDRNPNLDEGLVGLARELSKCGGLVKRRKLISTTETKTDRRERLGQPRRDVFQTGDLDGAACAFEAALRLSGI